MSRLPQPGERARILPSETMDAWGATGKEGVRLDWDTACIPVRLDDPSGVTLPGTSGEMGVVMCTNSEVEYAGGEG